jgi:hypothetical protein
MLKYETTKELQPRYNSRFILYPNLKIAILIIYLYEWGKLSDSC